MSGLLDRLRRPRRSAQSEGMAPEARQLAAERLVAEGNDAEEHGQAADALRHYDAALQLAPALPRVHLNRGNALLELGRFEPALAAYATALELDPAYASARFNMGNAYARSGRPKEALAAYRGALKLNPGFADAEVAAGAVLEELGLADDAAACYRRALVLRPAYAAVHANLGHVLRGQDNHAAAVASYRDALALDAELVGTRYRMAQSLRILERFDEAVTAFQEVLARQPDDTQCLCALGEALQCAGRNDEAIEPYRAALRLDAGLVFAHNNLGNALRAGGALSAAIEHYRQALAIDGDNVDVLNNLGATLTVRRELPEAIATFRRAIELEPERPILHHGLGVAYFETGLVHEAEASYRRALELDPDYADSWCNLGIVLHVFARSREAVDCYRRALAINPKHLLTLVNMGNTLKDVDDTDGALDSCERALAISPDFASAHTNRLFLHNYATTHDPEAALADALRFGASAARHARAFTQWAVDPDPERPLRVGFVSGDLRNHAVGFFVEGVLAALHARSNGLALFAYHNHRVADELTRRIESVCEALAVVEGTSDADLAQRIHDDRIDVLIDLSGHTSHNRVPMFAWKPAPVQATWLGYFATTGLAAIDWLIADPSTLPPEEERWFTERIWRLPETRLCFTAPTANVAVGPLPASISGRVTFGCFNSLAKLNDGVRATWARVLREVPDSRLLLKTRQLDDAITQQRVIADFASHGVARDRLLLEGFVPRDEYLAAYQRVDIALDPFPYPGGTTSAEALWMGVPVLTLAGERFLARQGVGLLSNAGLLDWVARDPDDYVARAVAHATDRQRLAALRAGLRAQVLASPVFDAHRFARHFEEALRSMWRAWCAGRTTAVPTVTSRSQGGIP